jgi:hypothetical protein
MIERLLVRSAPGVAATSSRVTRVVGVGVIGRAVSDEALTVTESFTAATCSCTWTSGAAPDTTVTSCAAASKPGNATDRT